jgi:hypothetical protein
MIYSLKHNPVKAIIKAALCLILMVIADSSIAQPPVLNMPTYDRAPWHPGFTLGFNTADFVVNVGPSLSSPHDSLSQISTQSQTGLNLGIVTDLRLSDNFDLRFIPTLVFASRELDYTFATNGVVTHEISKIVQSTFSDFPLMIKFKSVRINNFRIYVIGGVKYDIDFISQNKVSNATLQIVALKQNDFGLEYGIGMDFYFEYFKFSPELKVFHGLHDLLVHADTPYAKDIDGLFSKIFYLQFYFE